MPTDHLKLAGAIEDAGIPRDKAERIASAIIDAVHGGVATKTETSALMGQLTAVRTELKTDIAAVSTELSAARAEFNSNVASMHTELRDAINLNGRRLLIRIWPLWSSRHSTICRSFSPGERAQPRHAARLRAPGRSVQGARRGGIPVMTWIIRLRQISNRPRGGQHAVPWHRSRGPRATS